MKCRFIESCTDYPRSCSNCKNQNSGALKTRSYFELREEGDVVHDFQLTDDMRNPFGYANKEGK